MMTIEEVLEQMPKTPMMVSVFLPDGSIPVQGVLADPPEAAVLSEEAQKENGNLPTIAVSWDADLEYTLYWPVESVEQNGPIIRVKGPKGTLELRRRA